MGTDLDPGISFDWLPTGVVISSSALGLATTDAYTRRDLTFWDHTSTAAVGALVTGLSSSRGSSSLGSDSGSTNWSGGGGSRGGGSSGGGGGGGGGGSW